MKRRVGRKSALDSWKPREDSLRNYQCLEASKVIQEVEAGAAGMKAEKIRLEAVAEIRAFRRSYWERRIFGCRILGCFSPETE